MEEGCLTDSTGRRVSFRNAVVVMTTNAGGEITSDGLGFNPEVRADRTEQSLRRTFTPEFLGRLDEVLVFRALEQDTMERIAQKYLDQLSARARSRGMELRLPPELGPALARDCAGKSGARGLRSLVQTRVENPLAGFLLRCSNVPGVVCGALVEEKLVFS
jgi:ATP-dependent Clp protease ATP-binding subunit ClpA